MISRRDGGFQYSPDSQEAVVVKKIEIAEDVLSAIYEYTKKMETLKKKDQFTYLLQMMNDKVRDLE